MPHAHTPGPHVQLNRRDHLRLPVRRRVALVPIDGGPAVDGVMIDRSGGGARIAVRRPIAEGTMVRIAIARKGDLPPLTTLGQVVRSGVEQGKNFVGIAFGWESSSKHEAAPPRPRRWARLFAGLVGR